jgi:hypothetical protein
MAASFLYFVYLLIATLASNEHFCSPAYLPASLPACPLSHQVSGGGLTAQRALFRCGLSVRPFESLGLVQVVEADTGGLLVAGHL